MIETNDNISARIREELRKNPMGLTITDIASRIDINRNSTARYLDVLQISGQVEMRKVGPAKLYFLSQRVPLSAMLNLSEDGILTFDSGLNIIRVNDAFSRIMHLEIDELLGKSLLEIELDGLPKDTYVPLFKEASTGKQIDLETTVSRQEDTKYLRIKIVPTTFDNGITGATIIIEDITNKKNSDLEIQNQHDFLSLVMDSVAHPFYVIDANDYTIKMANRAARLGALTEESTCYSLTHGTSEPCSGRIHPCPLKQVVDTKEPATVEHVHRESSGRVRRVEIHAHPILDEDGNVVQIIEYNLDVTDRKQLESDLRVLLDMYQLIVENMEGGVFVLQHGKMVFCNKPFSQILGYQIHEITGADFWKFLSVDDRKDIAAIVSDIEKRNHHHILHSFRMIGKNKSPVFLNTRIISSQYAGSPATIFNILETDNNE